MKNMKALAAGIFLALVSVSAGAAELDKVILRLNFLPWAMHAPYYLGREQGIFQAQGIDLEIRPASSGQQNEMLIATEREQFGTANVDSFIKARAAGLKIVTVSMEQPNTPWAFMSLQKSNIARPEDLKGKRISWFQSTALGIIYPVLKAGGLNIKDVQLVTVSRGAEIPMLLAGQVDVMSGHYTAQAPAVEARGDKVNILRLSDYGLNMYGTLLYTSDALRTKNPDLVKRFVRAYLQSLVATIETPEKAAAAMAAAVPDINKELELRKLGYVIETYRAKDYETRFGVMTDAKWASSSEVLLESGEIKQMPDPSEFYTNEFLTSDPSAEVIVQKLRR